MSRKIHFFDVKDQAEEYGYRLSFRRGGSYQLETERGRFTTSTLVEVLGLIRRLAGEGS